MVNKNLCIASALFCCTLFFLAGDTEEWRNSGFLDKRIEIVSYLGFTLEEAFDTFGPPSEVFVYRGEEAWQDNVVFYFSSHLYLFWFENRVWQIRLDERYEGEIAGFTMGMPKEAIIGSLGEPFYEDKESCMYVLPDIGVPVRMRLFFQEGILVDMYIFRGDF